MDNEKYTYFLPGQMRYVIIPFGADGQGYLPPTPPSKNVEFKAI